MTHFFMLANLSKEEHNSEWLWEFASSLNWITQQIYLEHLLCIQPVLSILRLWNGDLGQWVLWQERNEWTAQRRAAGQCTIVGEIGHWGWRELGF